MSKTKAKSTLDFLSAELGAARSTGDKISDKPITDLLALFKSNSQSAELAQLSSNTYQSYFENLFKYTLASKRVYFNKKKSAGTAKQLEKCSDVVKLSIAVASPNLKTKTLFAIIDHITQVVPGPNGTLVEPLLNSYMKALADLLSYPSHAESLARDDGSRWHACVTFLINVSQQNIPSQGDELISSTRYESPAPGTPSLRSNLRATSILLNQKSVDSVKIDPLETALQALSLLVSAVNAPLLGRFEDLINAAIRVLSQTHGSVNQTQLLSFGIINSIISTAKCDDPKSLSTFMPYLLPLMTHWWRAQKSRQDGVLLSLRTEILKTIMLTQLQIENIIRSGDGTDMAEEVESLLESLWLEYSKRSINDKLCLDDITFSPSDLAQGYLSQSFFGLKPYNVEAESRWMLIQCIGRLESLLLNHHHGSNETTMVADDEHRRKKRRVEAPTNRVLSRLRSLESEIRLTALQIIPFVLETHTISTTHREVLLSEILKHTNDKDNTVVSWALVALACCSLAYNSAQSIELWRQPWLVATRAVTVSGTCRAACFLIHCILSRGVYHYHQIAEEINGMVIAADIKGPTVLCDTSIAMMLHLLHLRNLKLPNASQATSNHIIRWIFLRWTPRENSSTSRGISPLDLANLLLVCCGARPLITKGQTLTPGGLIYNTWCLEMESSSYERYLLLLPDKSTASDAPLNGCICKSQLDSASITIDHTSSYSTRRLILELLYPKLEDLYAACSTWGKKLSEGGTHIAPEALESLLVVCLASAILLPQVVQINSTQASSFEKMVLSIIEQGIEAALRSGNAALFNHLILRQLQPCVPEMSNSSIEQTQKQHVGLFKVLTNISSLINSSKDLNSSSDEHDLMAIDEEFESQSSKGMPSTTSFTLPRRLDEGNASIVCYYLDIKCRLHLLELFDIDQSQTGHVPSSLLEELVNLTDEEFLGRYAFIRDIFVSDLTIAPADALLIVQKFGAVIGNYAFWASEIALSTFIDVVNGLQNTWLHDESELSEAVGDFYNYLVRTLHPSNVISPKGLMSITGLLFTLLKHNPNYGTSLELDSCRTSLLLVLRNGSMSVKCFIAEKLPDLFNLFILSLHDDVFVDVLASLPADASYSSGIAFRLLVLAKLACKWPTLLRRCVYHIFETPGKIKSVMEHATRCMKQISDSLKLDSASDLFRLFSRQLLYTWMENDSIKDIPFEIFNFKSLKELLQISQAEASALALMRGQDEVLAIIAKELARSETDLLKDNFATTLTYCTVHSATTGGGSKDQGEARLKAKLTNKIYTECIYLNFVDIVALHFDILDQDDDIEKVLAKYPDLVSSSNNLKEIAQISCSRSQLPPNQQPTFRAKYVIYELARLCQSTEFQVHSLWTPALVVSITRKLLNTVHYALGPLHACSVLRKIRLVIALAGKAALESYCLEMLLDATRVFLVESECADDALGMSQYLLSNGSSYLQKQPSFLARYGLSTLASLRVFLESSQSSTTQESQFRATMTKAQAFHDWFTRYLASYSADFDSLSQKDAFQSITLAAANIRSSGNAAKNTYESKLLLNILRDGSADDQLLNEPSRQLALTLLCGDFSLPHQVVDDIIEKDTDATSYASAVCRSCKSENMSKKYLSWAGRVVGRSFASTGEIPSEMLRETQLQQYLRIAPSPNGSEMGILSLLQELTLNPDTVVAGQAEAALRSAVSQAIAQRDEPLVVACQQSLRESLHTSSQWGHYHPPLSETPKNQGTTIDEHQNAWSTDISSQSWLTRLALCLSQSVPESILLSSLSTVLEKVSGFASKALPFIIHLVLLFQIEQKEVAKRLLSDGMSRWLATIVEEARENAKLLINTLLYLRTQEYPKETAITDRLCWLDVDSSLVCKAAAQCGMYKSALFFVELVAVAADNGPSSRNSSSALKVADKTETLLEIFENIDDPDAYYGVVEDASLQKVLARVEYENEGTKTLAFRSAQFDSHIRMRQTGIESDGPALVKTLNTLGFAGLSHSLLQTQEDVSATFSSTESTYNAARNLGIWNLPASIGNDHYAVTTYKAYQAIYHATDIFAAREAIYNSLASTMKSLATSETSSAVALRNKLGALASLSELDELVNISDTSSIDYVGSALEDRGKWMQRGRYEDVNYILSCRATSLSMLSERSDLFANSKISKATLMQMEIRSLLTSARVYRSHHAIQEALNISTSLSHMIQPCEKLDFHVDAAVNIEVANSLWDHGEMSSSIRMLQAVDEHSSYTKQAIPVQRADLLAKIGHKASVARLEKPRDIQKKYLEPALKELGGESSGKEAGLVFHQFARFCDEQLQDVDGLEDLERLQNLRKAKSNEVAQLKSLVSSTKETQMRNRYNHVLAKEKQWLELDEQELKRVENTRAEFFRLSLENYLLSLIASDDYNNDALRFTALWLQRPEDDANNKAVSRHLSKVPTRKFANLMNQLTSRLQNDETTFQRLLMEVTYNVCVDHPYHGMYQVWSGTKVKAQQKDEVAILRVRAAERLAQRLIATQGVAEIWTSIDKTSKYYHGLALDRDPTKYKSGSKLPLKSSTAGHSLINCLARYRIPPPTMQVEISLTKDYSAVPVISKLDPVMTIASGVSAPKIITAIGSDGKRYKQLVKGGHDDLRQDAIMEQVFAAVSSLLKLHRTTQQRHLGIRTYKVLPLTASSGLIEFVPNTIPLHEFLMPAHERYYPRDLKGSQCRKEIFGVQNRSVETRISTYKKVTDRFHPVMKYFFMEYFVDPDDWFTHRLAYTRSTAAISMLGHILGLGDRHGHNILLDTKTGEAVHIDLGVAFEAGRILPVPELVPFRLTRDIVDGMGITKTEGVFRRCCEFTLDALREEQYSIMTILDVLRYDPLYTWSIAPLRMAKLQKTRQIDEGKPEDTVQGGDAADPKKGKNPNGGHLNEPSEAERALEIVRKKLSKALSVSATVNDLINQATDERHLAVLYCGWAAYA